MEKVIEFGHIGTHLGTRFDGASVREKILADFDEVEKLGATHISIEHGVSYDCSYVEIDAIARRIETDEEFEERVRQITQMQEEQKRRELQEFERLKSKYGQ